MLLRLTFALIGALTACSVLAADFQPVDSIRAAAIGPSTVLIALTIQSSWCSFSMRPTASASQTGVP